MLVLQNTTLVGQRTVNSPRALHACRRSHGSYIALKRTVSTSQSPVLVRYSKRLRCVCLDLRKRPTAARHLSTVQPSIANPLPLQLSSTSIPPAADEGNQRPKRSQIRDSLRAWSTQNDRIKAQSVPETLPYLGKIKQLPNSLFANEGDESIPEDADQESFTTEDGSDHVYGDQMRPGTLTNHATKLVRRQTVIYLGDIGEQSLLLLEDGRWAAEKLAQKRATLSKRRGMAVPNFLTPGEVDALVAHMPKQDVMRSAGDGLPSTRVDVIGSLPEHVYGPIRQKLKAWSEEVQAFARDHKHQMDQMYDTLALQDSWRRLRVADLPPLVLGQTFDSMTDAAKMCFITHCNQFHPLFITIQVSSSIDYLIGPKSLNETIHLVHEWARRYQEAAAQAAVGRNVSNLLKNNPLSSFIDRARRIILKSRKIRSPTKFGVLGSAFGAGDLSSSEKVFSGEVFTDDDKRIIAYLWDVAVRRPLANINLAQSSLIVRAVGAYPGVELGGNSVRMLLQEIGAINPWDRFYDLSVPVPGGPAMDELDKLLELSLQSVSGDDASLSAQFPDTMGHMRKDWATLKAFCIDSKQTRNIEDAISIEPSTSRPGAYWLHMHVAHPTAHFDPDHVISRLARKRGIAYYSHNDSVRSQKMIPDKLIAKFSLKPDMPTMTVSTLLDNEGVVHDTRIVPSRIRNMIKLDAASVEHLMGAKDEEAVLVVGKMSRPQHHQQQPAEADLQTVKEHLPSLQLIQQLLAARLKRRRTEVSTPADMVHLTATRGVTVDAPEAPRTIRDVESYHWKRDPGITIRGSRKVSLTVKTHERRSNDIVTQSVRLASESLAKWFVKRKIPAVFIGNDVNASFSLEKANKRSLNEPISLPAVTRTSTPRPLLLHNLQQYVQFTSPMRRYMDMINLFQIDSYLKAQMHGLTHKDGSVQDESTLAFSKTAIDHFIAEDVAPMDMVVGDSMRSDNDWFYQALFRAFHLKEAELPHSMEVLIEKPRHRDAQGQLQNATGSSVPWLCKVELEPSAQGFEETAKYHNFIPVEILGIDPIGYKITARATGPPTEEQQNFDPIKCYKEDKMDESENSVAQLSH